MIELRPQPIGVFPFPAGYLLLPPTDNPAAEDCLRALIRGDLESSVIPEWQFFWTANQDQDFELALQQLEQQEMPVSLQSYNAFLLAPTKARLQQAQSDVTDQLKPLLAAVAFSCGLQDQLMSPDPLDHELLAVALLTEAAAAIENQQYTHATAVLNQAVDAAVDHSPILAASLLSQVGDLLQFYAEGNVALAIQKYEQAVKLLDNCRLPMLTAEIYATLGMAYQQASNGQRGGLMQAVNAYQEALRCGIGPQSYPEVYGRLQNNLGLAYLSMPAAEASHQLRTGIAVQSFRHALEVYTLEDDPDMWASVNMNLANALQYAPSSHPQENLIQAVETYEQVLQVRSRAKDPTAYALVIMNQANALAHLGMFKPALEKLAEAYKLFHWYDQLEQAEVARELVEQINQQIGENMMRLPSRQEIADQKPSAAI